MKANMILAMVVLLGLGMSSCGGSQKLKRSPRKSPKINDFGAMREDFNPEDLKDDDIEIEEAYESQTDIDAIVDRPETTLTDTIGSGYRIQIVQTTDPDEAKNVQRDAILRFNDSIYRIFDPPFYKVRVGDFVNWSDAERLQKLAIQKGFRDAWVVRTKVNLKKAYRWMDDL
ncbi:MAG: SPOR domain-containing protein [bacterium]